MTEMGTRIVVLGAGTMGAGIAQCLADHGRDVTLTDIDALTPLAPQRWPGHPLVAGIAGPGGPAAAGRLDPRLAGART